MSSRLGVILVKDSLITADQLRQALDHQKKTGGRLGTCLVKLGLVSDDDITAVLSRQYGVPSINLKFYEVDPAVIKLVPQETAVRYHIVPLSRVGSTLTIAMTDPTNVFAMDDIKFMTGFNVETVPEEAPSIKLVSLILTDASKRGASDIHIEPYEKEFRARFRIDGILQNVMAPPMKLKDAISSR